MVNILSLPRELRDEIYKHALHTPLDSSRSRLLQRARKRITRTPPPPPASTTSTTSTTATSPSPASPSTTPNETTPGYLHGEESIRYPLHTSLPPAFPLLQTSRQLRVEVLDALRRMGCVRYKIDIANREDKDVLYPTWVSIPLFTSRIDVLDVALRVRSGKTSSVCSVVGEDGEVEGPGREDKGDIFSGGLALLQRFVERGVFFLSKKKSEGLHVGVLAIDVDMGPSVPQAEANRKVDEVAESVEEWMLGTVDEPMDPESWVRYDRQLRFLAQRIERVRLGIGGVVRREWVMEEIVRRRDAVARETAEALEAERVVTDADAEDWVEDGIAYCGGCRMVHICCICWGESAWDR
ncbi:hypothetical protein K432DRAFT_387021 [Lepidopterella palustris CBS 459.81]|uniref:Uncharacterized protein n=1 Tax=Lepidopterella palustris CBS 459.81 TaxID=1314670 RepID=A0A8E2DYE9_9PEZI|nr:hypothetical protein K432DRAFT_387021 [Lepidopterella palustris CBS 459.81]